MDTHGSKKRQWIGFDLDGTLAYYDHWRGDHHIGAPIAPMINRLKKLLSKGTQIKLFTARADGLTAESKSVIDEWCLKHIGQELEITNIKDKCMLTLYDDRAIQVQLNTGRIVVAKSKIKER